MSAHRQPTPSLRDITRLDVLGIAVQPSEDEIFWDEFLRSLADRGLRGTRLIIAPLGSMLRLPGSGRS